MSSLKVSVSGVRGVVGETLTVPLVANFARAFGQYVGGGTIIVGRDTRPSGVMYQHAVVAGLLAAGCQPLLAEVAATPTLLLLVQALRAHGGIAITASHNPDEWNALKFIGPRGLFLNHIEANELLDIYHQEWGAGVAEGELRRSKPLPEPFALHQQRIFAQIDVAAIRAAKLRVAADLCGGVGVFYTRAFLEALGCEVVTVHDQVGRGFPREPEPVPEHLGVLGQAVRDHGCAIGFAQDPDGDRLALVDAQGEPIGETYSVVLATAFALARRPGPVVVNLATSKAVADLVIAAGGTVHYSKIGEINVTSEILRLHAVVGGEGSGGVIWPAVHPCRDSFAAMAMILELLATRRQTLAQVLATLPRYHTANLKVPCAAERALAVVRRLRERFAERHPITLDGLRIDWDDRWVLVRASNTEAVLRITAEGRSPAAAHALAEEFQAICQVEAARE